MRTDAGTDSGKRGGKRSLLLAGLVFLLALPPLVMRMDYPVEWGDEGFFANGALRVLAGEVVYRDFQHNYPPGRIFSLALLVATFGQKMAVVHGLWVAFHAAAAALCFLVARRMMATPLAVTVAFLVLANTVHQNKSVELLLAAAVLWILFAVVEGRLSSFLAGIGMALVGYFRHDVAVFGAILFVVALALRTAGEEEGWSAFPSRFGRQLRALLPFLGGVFLLLAPLLGYLLFTGALLPAWHDLVHSGYLANKLLAKPFPPLSDLWRSDDPQRVLVFWTPVLLYAAGAAIGLFWMTGARRRAIGSLLLLVSLLGALLFLQVLPRTDYAHLNKAYVPAHLLGVFFTGAVLTAAGRAARARKWPRLVSLLVAAHAVGAIPFLHLVHLNVEAKYSIYNVLLAVTGRGAHRYERIELPHGTLIVNEDFAAEYRAIFAEMEPFADREDEWLLAFPAGANFNFLCGLRNPLRFDTVRPGELGGYRNGELIANHPDKVRELLERVAETRPRFLLQTFEKTNPLVIRTLRSFVLRPSSPTAPTYRYLETDYAILFVRNDP
jgi:hypothetical protein